MFHSAGKLQDNQADLSVHVDSGGMAMAIIVTGVILSTKKKNVFITFIDMIRGFHAIVFLWI